MVLRGFTQKLLRWPILVVVFAILGVEFLCYLLVRAGVAWFEWPARWRHRREKKALAQATDFVQWCAAARELDRKEGRDEWKRVDESPFFDWPLIRAHVANLAALRDARDFDGLLSLLKLIFQTYNVGGINNHQLYNETHFGTKTLVNDFIQAVLEASIVVRDAEELTLQQRRDFFRRARRWYGRTALMLSGGAAHGYYHVGVIKTLLEAKCLPQIISGASAGSLMSAFIACRTDAEVLRDLCVPEAYNYFKACEEPFTVKFGRWWRHGYCFDQNIWREHMRRGVTKGDTTFLEAYQKYGRIINIAVTATSKYAPTLILNYRSTPDVVIWSGVLASSAFPNFLAPIELQTKNPKTGALEAFHVHGTTFIDGTVKNDIPQKEMRRMWNANYFIVSQVNPHLVPFFFGQRGGSGRPATSLTKNPSSGLRGGFLLSMFEKLLKLEIKKWFKLIADLDLLPLIFGTDWRFIYLQKLTGTVTIVPDAPLWIYFSIISDPTLARFQHYILTGEKATWYKLCRVSNHYRIEKMLIECSRVLDDRAAKAGLPITREKLSHVNAGVIVHRNGTTDDGAADADDEETPVPPVAHGSRMSHAKRHAARQGLHVQFTTQDSSAEQQEQQKAFFHLQSSPGTSPSHRPASRATCSSGDEIDPADDIDVYPEPPALAHTAAAEILQHQSLWKRGLETDTDCTDEDDDRAQQ